MDANNGPKSYKLYQKKPVVQAFIKRPNIEIEFKNPLISQTKSTDSSLSP